MKLSDHDLWQILQVPCRWDQENAPAMGREWIEWAKAEVLSVGVNHIGGFHNLEKGCLYLARLLRVLDVLAAHGFIVDLCRQENTDMFYRQDFVETLIMNGLEACGCECSFTDTVLKKATNDKFIAEYRFDDWHRERVSGASVRTYFVLIFKGRKRVEAASAMPAFFDEAKDAPQQLVSHAVHTHEPTVGPVSIVGKSRNPSEEMSPQEDTGFVKRTQEIRGLYDKGEIAPAITLALHSFERYPIELVNFGLVRNQEQKPDNTPQSLHASWQLERLMNFSASFLTCISDALELDYSFEIGLQALRDVYYPNAMGENTFAVQYPRLGSIYRQFWPNCLDPETLDRLPMTLRADLLKLRDGADRLRRRMRNLKALRSAISRGFDSARAFFPLDEERLDAEELHEREHGEQVSGDERETKLVGAERDVCVEDSARSYSLGFEAIGKTLGSVHAIVEQSHLEIRKLTETSETALMHVRGVPYMQQELLEAKHAPRAMAGEMFNRILDTLDPEEMQIYRAMQNANGVQKYAIDALKESGLVGSAATLSRRVATINEKLKLVGLTPCDAPVPDICYRSSGGTQHEDGQESPVELTPVKVDWASDPEDRDLIVQEYLCAKPENKVHYHEAYDGIEDEATAYCRRHGLKSD